MRRNSFCLASVLGIVLGVACATLVLFPEDAPASPGESPFVELGGLIVIEAEHYHDKETYGVPRDWYLFPSQQSTPTPDPDVPHPDDASNGQYLEILPDTRVTDEDPLEYGVNFFRTGNEAPSLSYNILIQNPGRYYVRVRAYFEGTEDNGLHVGVDGQWPVSGTAIAWCSDPNSWTWSGARRTTENPCGIDNGIYLDLSAGEHTLEFAMREDGFEFDRFVLTNDIDYMPSGIGPAESDSGGCDDGLDNDGDGLSDCMDPNCSDTDVCQATAAEDQCDDGLDNDNDGLTDCQDPDCTSSGVCIGAAAWLAADFNTDSQGFAYADDLFGSTVQPDYASGNFDVAGGYADGGLHLALGGIDRIVVADGMSGGWYRAFSVPAAGDVDITLRYRLIHYGDFEPDECSQVLVAVDDQLLSDQNTDVLEEYCGLGDGNPTQDSGWRQTTLPLYLSAGTHTISVGGYLTQKTFTNEVADLYFDDIYISGQDTEAESDCSDGIDNDGDGLTDCDDDDCAGDAACLPAEETNCSDGLDDDGDGLTDCDDDDCAGAAACLPAEETNCSDGVDNDGDGLTDCDDDDCAGDAACLPAEETNCSDGLDDDGDGLTDCDDDDCAGDTACLPVEETNCSDGVDNDGDGQTDCADSDCAVESVCTTSSSLFSESFDTEENGFTYADNTFRDTGQSAYADGSYTDTGGYSGGGLYVALGGIDRVQVTDGMSGGWSRNFSLSAAGEVTVNLRYRLVHYGDFEPDECGQALVAVDGQLLSSGGTDYLLQYCGAGDGNPTQDSGWRQATVTIALSAGTHALTVGGFLTQKTYSNEVSEIYFDEIQVNAQGAAIESNCSDGLDNDGDGRTDCEDGDCAADAACLLAEETDCSDGLDNDGDGRTDCEDGDCVSDAACNASATLFTESFDTAAHGFGYSDDLFNSTSRPAYAAGEYNSSGSYSGGGLHLALGGIDQVQVTDGMSGGWTRDFTLTDAGNVYITLRYRLVHYGDFEPDECSQALVAVDGQLPNIDGAEYLTQFCGLGDGNPTQDSGWQQVTIPFILSAGSHTLAVGGYLTQKTYTNEVADIYFDDVLVETTAAEAVPYLVEDFDDSADGWTIYDEAGKSSDWQVVDGKLNQLAERVDGWQLSYHLGSFAYYDDGQAMARSDYKVSAQVRSQAQTAVLRDGVGLMLRYVDPDNFIRISISKKQGFIRLEKKVSGTFSNLAFTGRALDMGTIIDVTADIADDTLLVYVNDEPLFGVTDPDFAAGQPLGQGTIALYTQGPADFDQIVISPNDSAPQVIISDPMAYSVTPAQEDATAYSLSASAVAANMPAGGGVRFLLDEGTACDDLYPPYNTDGCASTGGFQSVAPGEHTVAAFMIDAAGQVVIGAGGEVKDTNEQVGVGGIYMVLLGDSISNGVGDDSDDRSLGTQDNSENGKNLNRGAAPILNDLISDQSGLPVTVVNEGLGGTTSPEGADRLESTLERHAPAVWLLLFGTNDSSMSINLPDGSSCTEADFQADSSACIGTYKYYMRRMILDIKSQGEIPLLAKVPYLVDAPQNQLDLIQRYNDAVDQLVAEHGLMADPPDLYSYFQNQYPTEFFDRYHPNGVGYNSVAKMWMCRLVPGIVSGSQPAYCSDF